MAGSKVRQIVLANERMLAPQTTQRLKQSAQEDLGIAGARVVVSQYLLDLAIIQTAEIKVTETLLYAIPLIRVLCYMLERGGPLYDRSACEIPNST